MVGGSDLSIKEFFICLNPHVFNICLSYNTINDEVIGSVGCDISIWIFEPLFPSMPHDTQHVYEKYMQNMII